VRDSLSAQASLELGVSPDRITELPDSVFSYPAPAAENVEALRARYGLEAAFGVLVMRGLGGHASRALETALERAGRHLLDRQLVQGLAVVVQVTGDASASRSLFGRLPPDRTVFIDDRLTPEELIALFASATIVCTGRLHSAIFATISGTPAISVGIDGTKNEGIYRSIGLPEAWVLELGELSAMPTIVEDAVQATGNRQLILDAAEHARVKVSSVNAHLS
jgi:polysaccharide pyruvyl transferase WcaK-like protein